MNRVLPTRPRRMKLALASLLFSGSLSAAALETTAIVSSVASSDCLDYRIVGLCYWLYCTYGGCSVRTSVKVRHYVPDAVVSSYANTGENPWNEVRSMSQPNGEAQGGGDGTTNQEHENNLAKFKNADVIGHPGSLIFSVFASSFGYSCSGAGTAFMPYLLSTLDTLACLRKTSVATSIRAAVSCISPTITRAPPWSPSAPATSSPGAGKSTSISRCSPARRTATGRQGN